MNFILHNQVKLDITDTILNELGSKDLSREDIYNGFAPIPNKDLGHVAWASFRLTKKLKQKPNDITKQVETIITQSEYVNEAKAAGPYLNITLNTAKIAETHLEHVHNGKYFKTKIIDNAPKSMVEFSQPNTHKEMHVGHMRNLCLGDAIIKIMRYCNIPTLSTTYPGDVGTHVAKCLWYFKYKNDKPIPKSRKGAWLGELYTKANTLLEQEKDTPKESENRKILTQILKEIEDETGEFYELWKETREWSVELMKEVYAWAHVSFDSWYWESEVNAPSVELVKDYYEKGVFIKDDGAIGVDLSSSKLGFALLLKSDGTGLYATKDIELARKKFEDQKIEKNIYVVDNRQSYHFKQVFKVLEIMGFENAKDCYHLQYEMVELPDGAMSSRKGNVVALQKLIDEMQSMIKNQYLAKYENEWSSEEIDNTAHIIAEGAIKYGMTRVDSNKKIIFDMQEWLKLDGESGPYIQYVCARINSILVKAEFNFSEKFDSSLLTNNHEQQLIVKLQEFNEILQIACEKHQTHIITSYLYELSKMFNSFYAECKIIDSNNKELELSRLTLISSIRETLKQGLSLLGITAPKRI